MKVQQNSQGPRRVPIKILNRRSYILFMLCRLAPNTRIKFWIVRTRGSNTRSPTKYHRLQGGSGRDVDWDGNSGARGNWSTLGCDPCTGRVAPADSRNNIWHFCQEDVHLRSSSCWEPPRFQVSGRRNVKREIGKHLRLERGGEVGGLSWIF